jgi:hypothetical protein
MLILSISPSFFKQASRLLVLLQFWANIVFAHVIDRYSIYMYNAVRKNFCQGCTYFQKEALRENVTRWLQNMKNCGVCSYLLPALVKYCIYIGSYHQSSYGRIWPNYVNSKGLYISGIYFISENESRINFDTDINFLFLCMYRAFWDFDIPRLSWKTNFEYTILRPVKPTDSSFDRRNREHYLTCLLDSVSSVATCVSVSFRDAASSNLLERVMYSFWWNSNSSFKVCSLVNVVRWRRALFSFFFFFADETVQKKSMYSFDTVWEMRALETI